MTRLTLEIRDTALYDKDSNRVAVQDCKVAAVAPTSPRARFEASYRDGILSVERLGGSSTVDVVSASGFRVATFGPGETRRRIALESGAWYAVQRMPGKAPLARSFAVPR